MDRKEIVGESLHVSGVLAAQKMLTAPKGLGRDSIDVMLIEDEKTLSKILEEAKQFQEKWPFFDRDAHTLEGKKFMILLAFAEDKKPANLNCGLCKADCDAAREGKTFCVFSAMDLGIALGVAVDVFNDFGVDNRIQWTLGEACKSLGLCPEGSVAIAIPMSVSSKNIFFDRLWWNRK
ncbi:ferredoxin domain-containing protein [Coprothermobacter platensis]|uniref:ferredoxin domain-containing protein n=1 Tax=Coprothermobacter platensis TaxID=108819 RepID=UPI0003621076|nr:DUF2148 domain-containing protein [Coprothermobacter platensis]